VGVVNRGSIFSNGICRNWRNDAREHISIQKRRRVCPQGKHLFFMKNHDASFASINIIYLDFLIHSPSLKEYIN
jgi:hypothetical protein